MEKKEKEYVQSYIKENTFQNGSRVINANLKTKDLLNHTNDEGWCAITIAERKTPSEKGATHYAYINEWKPEKKDEDLPF